MNILSEERQIQIVSCLVEGNSIRSTERVTNTHRDTIMRLMVSVGEACENLMDEKMSNLPCRRIQVDEIWTFVQKKQRHLNSLDDHHRVGDQYTFVALDPETKVVRSYRVGKRDLRNAMAFLNDLSGRLTNRIQLS